MSEYAAAREHMVVNQLQPNRVTDTLVADAMMAVPRERFVPEALAGVAYMDEDIEISANRCLMEPVTFGHMLQAAKCGPDEIVLDVACATGYSTAVLAKLAGTVVAMECDEEMAAKASELLAQLEVDNAVVVTADLKDGYPAQGPYDVIMIGGAVAKIPQALKEQLAEGGRLLAVVDRDGVGKGMKVSRIDGVLVEEELFDAMLPKLAELTEEPGFSF